MRRGGVLALAAVLVATVGGWWLGSPYWTLWRMREAAEARDAEALASRVEWPALRESTKRQLRDRLEEESRRGGPGGLDSIGAAFAGALIGPAVEALVTPETVRTAFLAERSSAEGGPKSAAEPEARKAAEFDVVRRGADEFRLRREGAAPGEGELVFRRHGLSWKLEEIALGK